MAEIDANTDPAKKGSYEFSQLETYGDLKKVIKSITSSQKVSAIKGGIKGKATDIALEAAVELLKATIPGIGLFKHGVDVFKGLLKKPDTKKTNTWLDKLDIDDEMSKIIDDTVENGFIEAMTKTLESKPDDKLLEPDFNMNAEMVKYLRDKYEGRTVAGIRENKEMKLEEYIKTLVQELLDEESASGDAGAFLSPRAFAPKGQGKNAATKYAEKMGFKLAKKPAMNNESNYDAASISSQASGYTAASGYTVGGIKGDDYYKKENMKETLLSLIEKEMISEVTYGKFKKDVKHRTKSEQLHKAIREVKRKLVEIDRIVEYTSRMKQELSEDGGINYWKATQKNVASISEMVNQLNNKIKSLNQ
jgi:hypothetical protein